MILSSVSQTGQAVENPVTDSLNTQAGNAEIKSKNEVVYAKLATNGTISGIYVVNHFEIEKGGSITDYGNYKSVLNLTESNPIAVNGDSVSVQTEAEDFYYQGNLETTDLPWIFDITYDMDGVNMSPQEIAGKTGKLGIHINVSGNEKVQTTFYENYMVQISLTLDSNKCKNIEAPDATIAEAGNNKMLTFTVMPNSGANLQVTADVLNFTMSGIEISAIPFSMNVDLPDTDDMIEEFKQLPEAIEELNDGVGKLAVGTVELNNGAKELKNGSSEFKNGLVELKENSIAITDASTQINDALLTISSSLDTDSTSEIDLSDITKLPQGLTELANGLKGISGGLNELKNGYSTAFSALDLAIQGIPDTIITEEQIDAEFPKVNDEQSKLLEQLYASYTAGQTVKGTYNQVKQAFGVVVPTIDTLSTNIDLISGSLDDISAQIGSSLSDADIMEQLSLLTVGLSDLAKNYSTFDEGLSQYMDGIGKMADGYNEFHSGLTAFGDGVGELNGGIEELYNGTSELNDEVAKMPGTMQAEIDKLTSEYDSSEFVPVSFVSPKNENTELVQFVLKCEGIELPDELIAANTTEEATKEETAWDRFVALFQ
jgi:X-X-X-Leu-X-X-Gly heptad repeat protein